MIVAVGGWRGNGATTAALALAVCFGTAEEPSWLVEADPAGGVLSGRMRLAPQAVGALEQIAFPTDPTDSLELFHRAACRVGDVMVVSAPVEPFRAHTCHRPRYDWQAALSTLDGAVVIDVGRLRSGTPAWPLLVVADLVLIVSSPEVSAVVSGCEWLQAAGRVGPTERSLVEGCGRLLVVEQPAGLGFGRDTLRAELGSDLAGWLPWDPVSVDLVHRGARADDRRLRRGELLPAVQALLGHPAVASGAAGIA